MVFCSWGSVQAPSENISDLNVLTVSPAQSIGGKRWMVATSESFVLKGREMVCGW